MLCLSVRQPWVWAIFHLGKDIENRTWPTRVRGRVLIHASKALPRADFLDDCASIEDITGEDLSCHEPSIRAQCGGIVGSVEIADCVSRSESPWFFGPYGFVLRDPQPLSFKPLKGRLGFFDVPRIAA